MNWDAIDELKFADEDEISADLVSKIRLEPAEQHMIDKAALSLVKAARKLASNKGVMESFLEEFGLSNDEGLALMCLAESLLRIPDAKTADALISERISSGKWEAHLGQSENWMVNASTFGLLLTGNIVRKNPLAKKDTSAFMKSLTKTLGEPVIRAAMMQAMRIMGEQYVVGKNIGAALKRSKTMAPDGGEALCSFDMLGESARTDADAQRYFKAYWDAITAIKATTKTEIAPEHKNGISVKLSALDPRYEPNKEERVFKLLYPRIKALCIEAAKANINLTIDAEEADRLVISLKILEKLCNEPELENWAGLGLAVQAYQKRSLITLEKIIELARTCRGGQGRRLMVRLVKGAYWDSEIKHAQIAGHADYPVWTRKSTTDLAFLACARLLLDAGKFVYPQFATHNAYSVAAIEEMASGGHHFEYQRLHGMGKPLYKAVAKGTASNLAMPCRVYAPVGAHKDLLPYLVRRLLENGANTSFVHSFLDDDVAPEIVAKSPFRALPPKRHNLIPVPPDLYGETRKNARGIDLAQAKIRQDLQSKAQSFQPVAAGPVINGKANTKKGQDITAPANGRKIGTCVTTSPQEIETAFKAAKSAFQSWDNSGGAARGKILRAFADKLEAESESFCALLALEAGKVYEDSIAEVREAVDFLRYYAAQAEDEFSAPQLLPGPAGERNTLSLHGRGIFVCISPWNFPLAIFLGQIAAALAAGNTVLAKPAEQTPLTAYLAVKLFLEAGLPKDVLHLITGDGEVGAMLTAHKDVAGVCFTGSTAVAKIINRQLAAKDGPIPVLIAETGGLNALFVDTSAQKEQLVDDVISSAFNAAGQRCSALRLLFLPSQTADSILTCLEDAMDAIEIGDPADPSIDIGPVIDPGAQEALLAYIEEMRGKVKLRKQANLPESCAGGSFVPPTLLEIDSLDQINEEQFGPILHVIRYKAADLPKMAKAFADKGYGLTLGVHSRLDEFAKNIRNWAPAGNCYVNRNIIGAVVGVQPFGGIGLSGTGPKAGGPHYLHRFAAERTVSVNISATGGDPALLNLPEL